jgi:hypothetical protein
MCLHYAPEKPDACDEDDAIEVMNKTVANFCDYFAPSPLAHDGREQSAAAHAREQLDALFGGESANADADADNPAREEDHSATAQALQQAEKLFRK